MRAPVPLFILAALVAACSTKPADGDHTVPPVAAATPTSAGIPAAEATGATNAADPELIRQGYRVSQRRGQTVYCKEQTPTGSRFATNLCLTADQVRDQQQRAREEMQRIRQNGCGSSACNN